MNKVDVLALGDIHGREIWKDILERKPAKHSVFIGDYFDSRTPMAGQLQIDNFRRILDVKRDSQENVSLLIGNHEFHYMTCSGDERSPGYNTLWADRMGYEIEGAISEGLLQVAKKIGDVLFTHAGVRRDWCDRNNIDQNDIENSLNETLYSTPQVFAYDYSGDESLQGPLNIRPSYLLDDPVDYKQVIGHSSTPHIEFTSDNSLTLIDTLGKSGEFLLIKQEEFEVGML